MEQNEINKQAWNTDTYEAWVNRFGTPAEAAEKLRSYPQKRIGEIYDYFEQNLSQQKVINLLGSNGMKAVALSMLGAQATVVDFSEGNERYAHELAQAAGVELRYILSDVLQLPSHELTGDYDVVFMENGILHYFVDLDPLFQVVSGLLKRGGKLILQDFHPVSTKLITSKGTTAKIRKHKVSGDYFSTELEERDISFSKYKDGEPTATKVYLRNWTLGEVVTSVANAGLHMKVLKELPNLSSDVFDAGIPKSFIIVAEKL
ncbi:class I SAM-dependent methyltransferase [Paenibacillus sp. CAU 1782]